MDSWRDPVEQPAMPRLLRWLTASFRIGRFFGVEVRCYAFTLVIVPLILRSAPGGTWASALVTTLAIYLVVYAHEMGHILAGRRYGIPAPLITLSPLGGLAHLSASPPGPKADAVVALAGPATHLIWLALLAPAHFLLDTPQHAWREDVTGTLAYGVESLWWMNLSFFVFNLLPFFPMDGGRVLRAFLATRMHPNRASVLAARVGQGGAVLFFVAAFTQPGFYGGILLAIAITNFLTCTGEIAASRMRSSPYDEGTRLETWQSDAEAWKRGMASAQVARGSGRPGPVGRWRARRRAQAETRQKAAASTLAVEVDRILGKVSASGLGSLTRAERRTLERASAVKRRGP